jgi:hypothetical protein
VKGGLIADISRTLEGKSFGSQLKFETQVAFTSTSEKWDQDLSSDDGDSMRRVMPVPFRGAGLFQASAKVRENLLWQGSREYIIGPT